MKPEKQNPLPGHGRTMGVPKGSKGKRPRKPVGLQIPETKQHEIAMRRAAGESKTAIARSLGMARKTVNRVLCQGKYQLLAQKGRSALAELVPRATGVLAYFLKRKKKSDKVAEVAIAILNGLQVFVPKSRTDIAVAQPNEFEGWTKEQILEYIRTGKKPNEEEFSSAWPSEAGLHWVVSRRRASKTDSRTPRSSTSNLSRLSLLQKTLFIPS